MPQPTAARGLRRAELITTDPEGAALFHQNLLGWRIWGTAAAGFECWVGERHCASLRPATHGARTGWRLVFAGARHEGDLVGPDEITARMVTGRAQHGPWAPGPRRGEPCWVDLRTGAAQRSDAFWPSTLGWTIEGDRYLTGGRPLLSRCGQPMGRRWDWVCHYATEDVDLAADRAVACGGRIVDGLDHPVLGEVVVIADPQGAVYGLAADTGRWGG
ncbi:VOC family protein [Saccharopolyspora sp. MS10]|uniref:VOC family protein n=1 Tax=Saccharopolyspora sp. MS10 TaxID=3385973 RepID=UPI0039A1D0DC